MWFHVETDDKLDPQAQEGIFVGYIKSRSQYLVLDQQEYKYKVISLVFLEGERGYISQAKNCNLTTNNIFQNTLFNRNEAIPTTRNNIKVNVRKES